MSASRTAWAGRHRTFMDLGFRAVSVDRCWIPAALAPGDRRLREESGCHSGDRAGREPFASPAEPVDAGADGAGSRDICNGADDGEGVTC